MNKVWSEENKAMQVLLKKEATFSQGVARLLALRESLFAEILRMERELPREAFWQMPFAGAAGYHSKTLAYSIWHIFRIEDIVTHELITAAPQVLFAGDYLARIGADRPTTGNELAGEAIRDFSRQLDTKALLAYAGAVSNETAGILRTLTFRESKRKMGEAERTRLGNSGCVSADESAAWLVDYWCGKDVCGLVKMPLSRHWIMHIEAMLRIENKLKRI